MCSALGKAHTACSGDTGWICRDKAIPVWCLWSPSRFLGKMVLVPVLGKTIDFSCVLWRWRSKVLDRCVRAERSFQSQDHATLINREKDHFWACTRDTGQPHFRDLADVCLQPREFLLTCIRRSVTPGQHTQPLWVSNTLAWGGGLFIFARAL